jgi:tRNA pseudouridine32 synthase/23S rRNA pseudouridine746 synthase
LNEARFASRWQLPPGDWATVLDGLCARFPKVGRDAWRDRMQRGLVHGDDGQPIPVAAPYRVGLELSYQREVPQEAPIPFEARIVHRDADLLVADKPHFLPVQPSGSHLEQTLLRRLARHHGLDDLVPLHRIDRATAGLVMFSLNPATRAAYQELFRERRIHKRYLALAPALPSLAFPIVRRSRLEPAQPFFRMAEVAGPANTESLIEVDDAVGPLWRYALTPVTGRKHQLRVHMAALGAPILNDPWYPTLSDAQVDDYSRPLKLLAQSLSFEDPITRQPRHFRSGLSL